ncbi:MAG TPA: phosphopantetheine-binding protein [Polyangiaceae bacterium]|nr:phosphopantetheine-binding protein [Polyangiaceae bacterium]
MADKISKETLRAQLLELFSKHAQTGTTTTEQSHITGDLAIDSLAVMEIVAEIEDTYEVSFPDDALPSIRTVGDVIRALSAHLEKEGRLA